jgi:hypothetical protein
MLHLLFTGVFWCFVSSRFGLRLIRGLQPYGVTQTVPFPVSRCAGDRTCKHQPLAGPAQNYWSPMLHLLFTGVLWCFVSSRFGLRLIRGLQTYGVTQTVLLPIARGYFMHGAQHLN